MYAVGPRLLVRNNALPSNLRRPMATGEGASHTDFNILQRRNTHILIFPWDDHCIEGNRNPSSTNTSHINESIQPGDKRPKDSTYSINDNCRSLADHSHVTFLKETNINYPRTIEFHISRTIEFHTPRTIENSYTKDYRTFPHQGLSNIYPEQLVRNSAIKQSHSTNPERTLESWLD